MKKRVLIVQGGWEGHQPKETTEAVAGWLREDGFEVDVADTWEACADEDALKQYHLLIPNWTMAAPLKDHKPIVHSLRYHGTGLAGWHGGLGDTFRADAYFPFLVGGQFAAHPGNIKKYVVEIVDESHPITRGLGDFEVESEQYYMHVDPNNLVLAATTFDGNPLPWIAGNVMPVVWTKPYGEARVFYCAVGHSVDDLHIPEVESILRRGFIWAARVA